MFDLYVSTVKTGIHKRLDSGLYPVQWHATQLKTNEKSRDRESPTETLLHIVAKDAFTA